MNWKRVLVYYGIALVVVSLSLITAPSYNLGGKIVVHVETADQVWQRAEENALDFRVNPLSKVLVTYRLKILWDFEINESVDRITTVIYRIFSNGVYVERYRCDFAISHGRGGGGCGPITIPSKTLKVGENIVKVHMTLNSTTSETPTRPGLFHLVVRDITVNTDNSYVAALIMILFVLLNIIVVYERKRQ